MTSRLTQYCAAAAGNVTPAAKKFPRTKKAQVSGVRRVQRTLYVGLGDGVCRVSMVVVVCVGSGVAAPWLW